MPDYALIAYESYAEHQGWKNYQGNRIPTWDAVRQDIKDAWESAAHGVILAYDMHIEDSVRQKMQEDIPCP